MKGFYKCLSAALLLGAFLVSCEHPDNSEVLPYWYNPLVYIQTPSQSLELTHTSDEGVAPKDEEAFEVVVSLSKVQDHEVVATLEATSGSDGLEDSNLLLSSTEVTVPAGEKEVRTSVRVRDWSFANETEEPADYKVNVRVVSAQGCDVAQEMGNADYVFRKAQVVVPTLSISCLNSNNTLNLKHNAKGVSTASEGDALNFGLNLNVTRKTDLTVSISVSTTYEGLQMSDLEFPAKVVIPAGERSNVFAVNVNDWSFLNSITSNVDIPLLVKIEKTEGADVTLSETGNQLTATVRKSPLDLTDARLANSPKGVALEDRSSWTATIDGSAKPYLIDGSNSTYNVVYPGSEMALDLGKVEKVLSLQIYSSYYDYNLEYLKQFQTSEDGTDWVLHAQSLFPNYLQNYYVVFDEACSCRYIKFLADGYWEGYIGELNVFVEE